MLDARIDFWTVVMRFLLKTNLNMEALLVLAVKMTLHCCVLLRIDSGGGPLRQCSLTGSAAGIVYVNSYHCCLLFLVTW